MGRLKDLVRKRHESVGQDMGQVAGQRLDLGVPLASHFSRPVGQQKPQNLAKNRSCPNVPPIRARGSGTAPLQAGTTRGTVSGSASHPKIIEATLREWHAHLSRLNLDSPPTGIVSGNWVMLCDDSWLLYENFSRVALEAGWTAQSLFGVNTEDPPAGGLAQILQSSRSVVFDGPRAKVRCWGVTLDRNATWAADCPLIWDLG